MHVIRTQMPFQNLALFLSGELMKYLPKTPTNLPIQNLPSALRYEHNVVLALPFCMA